MVLGILFILSLIFPRFCDKDIFNPHSADSKQKTHRLSSSASNVDLNLKSLSHKFWIFINYC